MMPIVYIHLGHLPVYLKLSVQQARQYNPKVVLISDNKPDFDCEWVDVSTVSDDVERFAAIYAHMSTNSKKFELICIKRWIILRNYMIKYNIDRAYYTDSDVMIYDNLENVYNSHYSNYEVCYTMPVDQENYRWTASACCSYWSLKAIKAFSDFIFHCYDTTGIKKLEEKWNYHMQNGIPGGVCDMTLFYLFYDKLSFCSLSSVTHDIVFDQNFIDSENYYRNEYTTEYSDEFELQVKKLTWENKQPYARNLKLNKKVRFIVLTEYAKLLAGKKPKAAKENFLIHFARRVFSKLKRMVKWDKQSKHGWFGNYTSWQEAKSKCSGYDTDIIFRKVREALLKVKNEEAVYERDSVLFNQIQYSVPLLEALKTISQNQELSLVDFGGSLGSTYFQNRDLLYSIKKMKWAIVEQKHFVDGGRKDFETENLKFFYDIPSAIEFAGKRAILLSSVIQYFEKPYDLIHEVINHGFDYIIIDRTAFIEGDERITVQIVPEFIYKASYPAWFLNETKFKEAFGLKYDLLNEFDSKFDPEDKMEDGKRVYRKGFLFKLK